MSPAILAAITLAQAQAPAPDIPPTTVSPLTVTPALPPAPRPVNVGDSHDWLFKPPQAEILSVWPRGDYEARVSGKATLACRVDAAGLAEECRVASETPPGRGFGAAALLLRTTFKLEPAIGPEGPVSSMMSVTVEFNAEDNDDIHFHLSAKMPGQGGNMLGATENGMAPEMREVTMLDHPVWLAAASFEDVARAYPAKGRGVAGFAVAHCRVKTSGNLWACEVRKEDPENRGFGAAAVSLAYRFRASLDPAAIPRGPPLWVDIPIRFPAPGAGLDRTLTSPTWLAGFDPRLAPRLFPPEAAAKGLTTGRGVAQCVVTRDGALADCAPLPGDPADVGFSEAAVKLASLMRMNPWTADGRPVDGAVIRLPIRLNLATQTPGR